MKAFARQHPFTAYYVLAFAIICVITLANVIVSHWWPAAVPDPLGPWHYASAHHMVTNLPSIFAYMFGSGGPMVGLILLFGAAPSISALTISAMNGGGKGVVALLSRFKPWREGVTAREAVPIYVFLFAVYLVVLFAYLLFAYRDGPKADFDIAWTILGASVPSAILIALYSVFLDEGGTPEELGWRGFALPILQEKLQSPLVAAIVLGFLWWFWHFPRELPSLFSGVNYTGGKLNLGAWGIGEAEFCLYVTLLTIVMAYFFNRTGGSVWPAILIHGGTNFWVKSSASMALWDAKILPVDTRLLILAFGALVIVIISGAQLGRRQRLSPALIEMTA